MKKLNYIGREETAESYEGSNKTNYIIVESDGKTILFNDYEDDACTLTNQEKLIRELKECPLFEKEIVDKFHPYLVEIYKTEQDCKRRVALTEEQKSAKQRRITSLSFINDDKRKFLMPLFKPDAHVNVSDAGRPILYIEMLRDLVNEITPDVKGKERELLFYRRD